MPGNLQHVPKICKKKIVTTIQLSIQLNKTYNLHSFLFLDVHFNMKEK